MTRRTAVLTGLAFLVIGVAGGWLAYWHSGRQPGPAGVAGGPPQARGGSAAPPEQEVSIKHPVIKHTEGGRTAWQVRLKELKVSAGAQSVSAAGMREAVIYDKTGTPALRLTAQQARGNTADRNLEVSGAVRATSSQGALITTDRVRWLEQERRLLCPGLVTVRTRNASLTTRGLSYYVDTDTVKAPGLVRVYSGGNKLIGHELVYNVRTENHEMKKVQAIFNPREVRKTRQD